ncbi:MAG: N-acetylmuramoyl-L-alanine amidase, partial [Lachnospiraceae bacterium]|nr:N-acetylmuramoyl-L-alanine amidase [Lachnospiraceae bacterium]
MGVNMQQNQLMKITAIYTVLFAVCVFAVIIYYSANNIAGIEEVPPADIVQTTETAIQESTDNKAESIRDENSIIFEQNGQEMNYFCIPLHESVKAESVMIENHYMDKELWVSIKQTVTVDDYENFYRTQGVYGNRKAVSEGRFESKDGTFWLKFKLNDIYEYHSIFEDNKLYVEFVSPKEVYDRIVVIDPAYGGDVTGAVSGELEGKDVTLSIARALKEKLDKTDIKVYYTRMDDNNPSDANRIDLTNAVKADLMIRIEVNENEDTKIYGTEAVYNGKFFIPGFGSPELADLLERNVATQISGKANGLVDSADEDVVIN